RELLNLSASYKYRSKGYYASLLAEARGHPILPSVETMLELREDKLCEHALPQLEDALNRDARRADFSLRGKFKLLVCFGAAGDRRFDGLGRLLFNRFPAPALELTIKAGPWLTIERIRLRSAARLNKREFAFFEAALDQHTAHEWQS